jgi:outer membrane protein assembly factor BamB
MYRLPILALAVFALTARADDWPQWLGTARDGVWREKGILTKFPKGGPKELWRVPIGGGYAGPAVADGLVYVTDRQLATGQKESANPFARANSRGKERILALDAKTGKEVWKYEYDCKYTMSYPAGPRATPVVHGGKVWTIGGMGDVLCLDAKKGTVLWSKNLMKEYDATDPPVWGYAAHLLIDGDNVITLASKKAAVVALNKDTGKEVWKSLEMDAADIGYCPPMIYTFGGKRQLIIWHPESVNGLDPATGKPLWSYDWKIQANLTVPTPRQVGDRLFLTAFYNGSRLLEVKADGVKELWRSKGRSEQDTQALHSIMPTPFIEGRVAYGVCSYGQLRAIDIEDGGKRLWEDYTATGAMKPERWANAFLTPNEGRYFLFNEKGDLIIAKLSPKGYEPLDRAHLIAPTGPLGGGKGGGRMVVWSHPAYANKAIYVRNDKEIAAFSLAAE